MQKRTAFGSLMAWLLACGCLAYAPAAHAECRGLDIPRSEQLPVQPAQNDGLQAARILVTTVVGVLPGFHASYFETAPSNHPWVLWFPDNQIESSWYTGHLNDHPFRLSPYILNGGAASAASAGFVLGLTY